MARPKRDAMFNTLLKETMDIFPEGTLQSLKEYEDMDVIESFGNFALKRGLKGSNYGHITRVMTLNNIIHRVKSTIRSCMHSAQFLSMLAHRLLRAARVAQRFIRRVLSAHRAKRKAVLETWKHVETLARQKLRVEIEHRSSKANTPSLQRMMEEMWQAYLDCWVSADVMDDVVQHVWLERKMYYLKRFREWKKKVDLDIKRMPRESHGAHQLRVFRFHCRYNTLKFSPTTVSIAELCSHLQFVRQLKIMLAVNAERVACGDEEVPLPKVAGDPAKLVSPVSFYHALLEFEPGDFYFIYTLQQLKAGEAVRILSSTPFIKRQIKAAREVTVRWKAEAAIDKDESEEKSTRYEIGSDGQPRSHYCFGTRKQSGTKGKLSKSVLSATVTTAVKSRPGTSIAALPKSQGGSKSVGGTSFVNTLEEDIEAEEALQRQWEQIKATNLKKTERRPQYLVEFLQSKSRKMLPSRPKGTTQRPFPLLSPSPIGPTPPRKPRPRSARAPLCCLIPCDIDDIGNSYTNYNDGSYRYTNNTSSGNSHYYNDGGKNGGSGFYSNNNIGYSSYTRSDGTGWSKYK